MPRLPPPRQSSTLPGPPLIPIPFLGADNSCYAFQVPDYAVISTIAVDLRGAGGTDKPAGAYSTQLFADDVAAFMEKLGIGSAHVAGMSLGSATATWLAARHPEKVRTLSLHSSWTATDRYTFGAEDRLTSTRFARELQGGIRNSELVIFDGCAHAAISEHPQSFNRRTLDFLLRH